MLNSKRVKELASEAYQDALCTLIRGYHDTTRGMARKDGSFDFVPMSTISITRDFILLKEVLENEKRWSGQTDNRKTSYGTWRPIEFLDAGCGIGNILLLARATKIAQCYTGIEYFDETFQKAINFLSLRKVKDGYFARDGIGVIQDDIMTFKDYGKYDIVYFYCPFSSTLLQDKFEERVEDEMKVGAVLIPRLKRSNAIHKDKRFEMLKGINDYAFLKVRDGKRKVTSENDHEYEKGDKARMSMYKRKYSFIDS